MELYELFLFNSLDDKNLVMGLGKFGIAFTAATVPRTASTQTLNIAFEIYSLAFSELLELLVIEGGDFVDLAFFCLLGKYLVIDLICLQFSAPSGVNLSVKFQRQSKI